MKTAVIGAGYIAKQHLACLSSLPNIEVAGVCDLSPAMAESAAERFAVRAWFTDHRKMLQELRPDVVHITTPPSSHFALTMDALRANAHVLVEKPIVTHGTDFATLAEEARKRNRALLEDHNYLFDRSVQRILALIADGSFGQVTHVEVMICLDILGKGSRFADLNSPHPSLNLPGGAIADFLTHLCYLAYAFVGPHRAVRTVWSKRDAGTPLPSDELRALVDAERGTALLAFSAHTQPDAFWLRVYGTRMRASANLFEPRLTIDRLYGGARPLIPLRNGMRESWDVLGAALGGLRRKLSGGPGAYEGLWELLRRLYRALSTGTELPIPSEQFYEVSRLVGDLTKQEYAL